MLLPEVKQGACQVAGGCGFAGLGRGWVLPVTRWMHPMEAGLRWFGAAGARFNQVRRSGYMPISRLSVGGLSD